MTANLGRTAKLESMVRLGATAQPDGLERAGREPTTPAEELEERGGYEPGFLDGWSIGLPMPSADMRRLRRGGDGVELRYQHFSVIMSESRRLPIITASNIDGSKSRRIARTNTAWRFDGRLDKDDQWGDALYDTNALDRGHMVRREDPIWGTLDEAETANVDTFHFTNSCPQMAGVNQRTWLGLEDYILRNARVDKMRVAVFTGPFFTAEDLPYRDALVPLSFWKVVAIVTDDGRPSATAYKVDQSEELGELEFVYGGYKTFQISINQVIEGTGVDLRGLVAYDGFSAYENAGHGRLEERLDSLEMIRV